ncbi:MAG TPA: gamma carbonic anhydrase family protein [Candidatus Dormibacteraeota bacterium]|nr:gamma carbonic anhydrase family protein [Candidatus Dormibacteraeota bacterium]
MIFSSGTKKPKIHSSAYVAPTAVVSGDVTIEAGCAILHGAVVTAEGAPIAIGAECVIMEQAVVKSSGGSALNFPVRIGERCIVGPHAYVVGASISAGCFIASGARIFNGARIGERSSVALGATVHISTVVAPGTRVPMQHIAYGDPARIVSPEHAAEVHEALNFFETVFNLEAGEDVRAQAATAYARFLRKAHAQDAPVGDGTHTTKSSPRRSAGDEPPKAQIAEVDGVVDAMMLELQEMEHRRAESLKKKPSR